MKPIFEGMRNEALENINTYSSKNQMGKAYSYFLNNYDDLNMIQRTHAGQPVVTASQYKQERSTDTCE